jgi:hypothetical protein
MLDPVKIGLAGRLAQFYAQLEPTTPQLAEFTSRGLAQSLVWAPSRMVDQADDMLNSWRRNDASGTTTQAYSLPVMLFAVASEFTAADGAATVQVSDPQPVIIPSDPKERVFRLRVMSGSVRAQAVAFASNPGTAQSLMAQLLLWLAGTDRRRFDAVYRFAGINIPWGCSIQPPPDMASRVDTETSIVTALALDLDLLVQVPFYTAPGAADVNDGKGTDDDPDDPHGWPVVDEIARTALEPLP